MGTLRIFQWTIWLLTACLVLGQPQSGSMQWQGAIELPTCAASISHLNEQPGLACLEATSQPQWRWLVSSQPVPESLRDLGMYEQAPNYMQVLLVQYP